ncbi:SHOCT domain-containing protein [Niveibacterium sp. SC-1]|uniref:SHOCT domain-containing protein n=1 Tax=Niveibacterium sp. SC-1 TaxID=3135646 RepID=UPI00311DB563
MLKSHTIGLIGALALTTASLIPVQAHAASLLDSWSDLSLSKVEGWMDDPSSSIKWGEWDRMKLERRTGGDRGTPNQQPVQITEAALIQALSSIQVDIGKGPEPLFMDAELKQVAPAFVAMLSVARPNEDVLFASTGEHVRGKFRNLLTNVGRLFYVDGRVNVMLGMALKDVNSQHQATGQLDGPTLDFGRRDKPTKYVQLSGVTKGDAQILRNDWIAVAAPATAIAPGTVTARGRAGDAQAAQNARNGAVAAAPAAAAAASADPVSKQENRFKALQRLKDQGLITDAEFQQKRAELLKEL